MVTRNYNLPRMTKISSYDELAIGITTRVFAKKLQERRASLMTDNMTRSSISSQNKQRLSFLEGTAIPNSILKNQGKEEVKRTEPSDYLAKMKDRDEFVEKLLNRIKEDERKRRSSIQTLRESVVFEKDEWDQMVYEKIQKELARLNKMEDRENIKKFTRQSLNSEDEKRISRRTGGIEHMNIPLTSRRPTVDSIKSAIENVHTGPDVINITAMENEKFTKKDSLKEITLDLGDVPAVPNRTSLQNKDVTPITSSKRSSLLATDQEKPPVRRKSILKQNGDASLLSPKKRVSIQQPKIEAFHIDAEFRKKIRNQNTPLSMKIKPVR